MDATTRWSESSDRSLVPSKVLDAPISEGVHVILLGGKPGSGVRTCTTAIQERLALQRIVCERVEDCEYVALRGPCLFFRKNGWDSGCIDAPQALQIDLLYNAIEKRRYDMSSGRNSTSQTASG